MERWTPSTPALLLGPVTGAPYQPARAAAPGVAWGSPFPEPESRTAFESPPAPFEGRASPDATRTMCVSSTSLPVQTGRFRSTMRRCTFRFISQGVPHTGQTWRPRSRLPGHVYSAGGAMHGSSSSASQSSRQHAPPLDRFGSGPTPSLSARPSLSRPPAFSRRTQAARRRAQGAVSVANCSRRLHRLRNDPPRSFRALRAGQAQRISRHVTHPFLRIRPYPHPIAARAPFHVSALLPPRRLVRRQACPAALARAASAPAAAGPRDRAVPAAAANRVRA